MLLSHGGVRLLVQFEQPCLVSVTSLARYFASTDDARGRHISNRLQSTLLVHNEKTAAITSTHVDILHANARWHVHEIVDSIVHDLWLVCNHNMLRTSDNQQKRIREKNR